VNYVDISVLVVIALSALLALGRGLVKEILSLFGWVGAAIVTYLIFLRVPAVQEFARQQIAEPLFADIAAGVTVFTVALLVLGVVNHFIVSRVPTSLLGPLDKSLGLVFGLARGAVVVAIAHILLVYVLPNRADWPVVVQEARTEPYAGKAAVYLMGLVPEEFREQTGKILDEGADAMEQDKSINDNLQNPTPGTDPGINEESGLDSGQNSSWTQGSDAGNEDGQDDGSGYKDAERKDLQRLLQGQSQ